MSVQNKVFENIEKELIKIPKEEVNKFSKSKHPKGFLMDAGDSYIYITI